MLYYNVHQTILMKYIVLYNMFTQITINILGKLEFFTENYIN